MEQRSNYAAVKDAKTLSSGEEFVLDMEQRSSDAAMKDAQINPQLEVCAGGTERK